VAERDVSRILFRYVVRTYFAYFAVIATSALTIFLVADFVDRAKAYRGANWVVDVLVLYGYKALVAAQQLGPAITMLAAGATISVLRKRGELTALKSLAMGPLSLYLPVGICALVLAIFLAAFDETVVLDAGRRVDEISLHRFNHWGDWRFHYWRKQWFRIGNRVFYLRQANAEEGYVDATVLSLSGEFDLVERIDAGRMVHLEGTKWELSGVLERHFGKNNKSELLSYERRVYDFGKGATWNAFRIREGRPEQMHLGILRNQIDLRRNAGLPVRHFSLALHNRFAYPLTAVPAALLAVGVALRPGRRGHLMVAMVEGLVIAIVLWGLMVVSKTLVMADRMNPGIAAWAPALVLIAAATVTWLRREGKLGWKGI
jgi:lipopolysaccharide export system permease protein